MVFDLERSVYQLIPNTLYEILYKETGFSVEDLVKKYAKNSDTEKIIKDYFFKLLELDLIFKTNFPEYYPKLSFEWDYQGEISNAVIDIDIESKPFINSILSQLEELNCRTIQLRSYNHLEHREIDSVMASIDTSIIETVQIILPFISDIENEKLVEIAQKYLRLRLVQIYGCDEEKLIYSSEDKRTNVVVVENSLINEKSCGVVSAEYFSVAFSTFSESQHHNSCLNRKISIDKDGNIKNCPSMSRSYGNIKNTTLQEALDHPDFKKVWDINKDKIHVCKDCEFRYICTDCRAYIEDPADILSKPLKCGYNPYTGEWSEWSTNPLKQKAIEYYEMQELVKEE